MTAFGPDPQPLDSVSSVAAPGGGSVTFSSPLDHRTIGEGWATWSNGYTGDVYVMTGTTVTLTMPSGTLAFSLYVEPDHFADFNVTATAQDGTTSGPVVVNGSSGAKYFGFYTTSSATPIASVTVSTTDTQFAIGEFGIDQAPSATSSSTTASQPETTTTSAASSSTSTTTSTPTSTPTPTPTPTPTSTPAPPAPPAS